MYVAQLSIQSIQKHTKGCRRGCGVHYRGKHTGEYQHDAVASSIRSKTVILQAAESYVTLRELKTTIRQG